MSPRALRFGMIGGGRGSFIGAVHRMAVRMEGGADLVAGVFSHEGLRSHAFGAELGLAPDRVYGGIGEMVRAESERPADERLDFVSIVAPTTVHASAARQLLDGGFNVICEKPLVGSLAELAELQRAVEKAGLVFILTHNYTGHPMVKRARELVRAGRLGVIRKVCVEYLQGWKARRLEARDAPGTTGEPPEIGAGCLGEIGCHAYNLLTYVTGLHARAVCAEVSTNVEGRPAHDDATVLLRFDDAARGVLNCSQVAVGEQNNLNIRIYGSEGSLKWRQEEPDSLVVEYTGEAAEVQRKGTRAAGAEAARFTRLPPGHPEGYLEAFANIYREALRAIRAQVGHMPAPADLDVQGIREGAEGVRFIDAALRSADTRRWTEVAT